MNNTSNKYFKLFVDFSTKCNLKCSYCFARKEKDWQKNMTKDNIDVLIDFLNHVNDKLYVLLFGGESLLHPDIDYIIQELSKTKHQIVVLSNGTLPIKHYSKLPKDFYLSLTYHSSSNIDLFEANIQELIKSNFNNIFINILIESDKFQDLVKITEKYNLKYVFTQLYDDEEAFINPLIYKKTKNILDINNFQDKDGLNQYFDYVNNHLKINKRKSKKICWFNEGNIDINLNYWDECRKTSFSNLSDKNNLTNFLNYFNSGEYKKPMICGRKCGDCYGKIICNKKEIK